MSDPARPVALRRAACVVLGMLSVGAALWVFAVARWRDAAFILVYHRVEAYQGGRRSLYVTPEHFERQMRFLVSRGYRPVTLDRVREMLALMQIADGEEDAALRVEAGRLLLESHASYSDRLDLGAPETDEIVKLVLAEGPENGLYGGRITGGGSGGTVCVLCDLERSEAALTRVLAEYEKRTGLVPRLIAGTSPGALQFRVRHLGALQDGAAQA